MFECRVLGSVEVRVDDRPVDIGPARQRGILAVLLVEANTAVGVDQLIDRVWGERQPLRVRGSLYSHLTRLRTALAPTPTKITARSGSYTLEVDEQAVDLHRFRRLMAETRNAPDERALTLIEQALDLWRGEPFAGMDTPWLAEVRAGLERERLAARLDHADVALRCGGHTRLLPGLTTLAAEFPLDERIAGQLMLALYRAGRQADALAQYQRIRTQLADELGADPGPELRELHQKILSADDRLITRPRAVVPRQLPAAPWAFTGREDDLAALTTTLDERRTLVISAIRGTGGIGKTWLALAWAHRHLDRFPDGQLFVDLRGFSPDSEPMPPEQALRVFLDALGVDPARVPNDLQARSGLLRSILAERRMLVVLDNAADVEQVEPLLPGGDSCTVLVTSRRTLTGLITRHGAQHLALDPLRDNEARAVLARRLGAARVEREPQAVEELVGLCGGLPLALGIIAGRALANPRVPLAELAAELRGLGLSALDDDDPGTALPTVLSWSYHSLTTEQQHAFALLGNAPGPDISVPAAASLIGVSTERTGEVLHDLEEASLLSRDEHERYSMHDLVRRYATDVEPPDEAALRRVVDFYTHTAVTADAILDTNRDSQHLAPPAPGAHPLAINDIPAAVAWIGAERACVMAAQQTAAAHGWHRSVWLIAWGLTIFHFRRGHRHDQLTVWQLGQAAAAQLGEPAIDTLALRQLGYAHVYLGHFDEGVEHLHRSLALAEHHDDLPAQAHVHRALTWTWGQIGNHRKSLEHGLLGLRIYRELGAGVSEAQMLNNVGWSHARLGEFDAARDHCTAALALYREHVDLYSEAVALDSLGYVEHHTGNHAQAAEHYRRALALHRQIGATAQIVEALRGLGHPLAALDRLTEARAAWREAIELYRALGSDEAANSLQRELDALD